MAEYRSLAAGVHCIDALYIRPGIAAIYLLCEGDEVAIIETGTSHSVDNVVATLQDLSIDPAQVRYVIPTHVHLDHAGGAGEMMRRFAQATLIVHPRGARHMVDPGRLVQGTIDVYGAERFAELYGRIEPIPQARIEIADDEARFALHERELVFIDTPGHARHHFCIYDARSAGVFSGDTFGISYRSMKDMPRGLLPTTPPTQFDPPALRRSIRRIMEFKPERLYLTHFGEFAGPAAQLASFDRWIDQYVAIAESRDSAQDDLEQCIESDLLGQVLEGLDAGSDESLRRLVAYDVHLNAQGLAHWRRSSG